MYTIRPWLYTGSYVEKIDGHKLEEKHIGSMLQLFRASEIPHVVSLYLPVEDGYPIPDLIFRRGVKFINEHRKDNLLIACGAGISRSSTFAILALKYEEGLDITEGLKQVRLANPGAMPDQVHWESLCRFTGEKVSFWDIWQDASF